MDKVKLGDPGQWITKHQDKLLIQGEIVATERRNEEWNWPHGQGKGDLFIDWIRITRPSYKGLILVGKTDRCMPMQVNKSLSTDDHDLSDLT